MTFSLRDSQRCQRENSWGRKLFAAFSPLIILHLLPPQSQRINLNQLQPICNNQATNKLENRKIKNLQTHPGNTSDSRSRIRGGGLDQLLEHRFKPKPVRQDPPLCSLFLFCIFHIIYYISILVWTAANPKLLVPNPVCCLGAESRSVDKLWGEKGPPLIVLVLGQKALLGVRKTSWQGANN